MDAAESKYQAVREVLSQRVIESGVIDGQVRAAAMARGAGGAAVLAEPYDTLASQIASESYRVTDAQVGAVREAVGSDKGAFEIIFAASIGAGLVRGDAALRAIDGLDDALA